MAGYGGVIAAYFAGSGKIGRRKEDDALCGNTGGFDSFKLLYFHYGLHLPGSLFPGTGADKLPYLPSYGEGCTAFCFIFRAGGGNGRHSVMNTAAGCPSMCAVC